MALPIFSIVLIVLGSLIGLLGVVALIISAFRESLGWGLVVLLVPLGNVVYTCVHWTQARAGFLLSVLGSVLSCGAVFTLPNARALLSQVTHAEMAGFTGLATTKAAPAPDLNAQIAEKRKALEELQATFANSGRDLPAQYQQLEKRRKALKAGDEAAITKFNEDAAAYQALNQKLKGMQQEIAGVQSALDQLLDQRSREAASGTRPGANKKVVMYTTSHCPACKMAKQYMAQKGISYQEVDVESSRDGKEAFRKLGGQGVPLIMIGEKRMEGFNSQELERMLL